MQEMHVGNDFLESPLVAWQPHGDDKPTGVAAGGPPPITSRPFLHLSVCRRTRDS